MLSACNYIEYWTKVCVIVLLQCCLVTVTAYIETEKPPYACCSMLMCMHTISFKKWLSHLNCGKPHIVEYQVLMNLYTCMGMRRRRVVKVRFACQDVLRYLELPL